jgi:hypothetical protein
VVFSLLPRGKVVGAIKCVRKERATTTGAGYCVLYAIQHGLETRRRFLRYRFAEFLAVWKPDAAESGNHSGEETDRGHDHAESHW